MTHFKINPNSKVGWLIIERGQTTETLQIFFNDEEFLKMAGSENNTNAIDLFEKTAQRKNRMAIIFDYQEFAKWDLRYRDNYPEVFLKAEELGWVMRI